MNCIEVNAHGIYRCLFLYEDDFAHELAKLAVSINGKKLYTLEDIVNLCQLVSNCCGELTCYFTEGTTLEVVFEYDPYVYEEFPHKRAVRKSFRGIKGDRPLHPERK